MGVDLGRGKILVPEQVLHGADVGAASEQVRGKGVTKGMGADVLRQTGPADRYFDGFVDDAGINMMTACDTSTRVYGEVPGGEDLQPAPLLGGIGILPIPRMGQVDFTVALSRIPLMQRLDPGQLILKQGRERGGNGGEPVLVALARTDGQWLHLNIDVMDPDRTAGMRRQPLPQSNSATSWAVPSGRAMTTRTLIFLSTRTALMRPCMAWLRRRL